MAFEFFRRRQKMVVIIMAVLMVSFLVGAQGLNMLTQSNPSRITIGATIVGKMRLREVRLAAADIRILYGFLGLGTPKRTVELGWPMDIEFLALITDKDPDFTYALLLKEAEAAGHKTYDSEVEKFLQQIGLPKGSAARKERIDRMRERGMGNDKQLTAAVGRWLTIHKGFQGSNANTPPSERELRRLYTDLNEQIDLQVAAVTAESMLAEAPEPSEEEVSRQFEAYRSVSAGNYSDENLFGFGYKQPDRARLAYVFVAGDVVERVTSPAEKTVRDYYRRHLQEFVPEPTTMTASAPATAPSGPRRFSQVKAEIAAKLKSRAVEQKIEDVMGRVETLLAGYPTSDGQGKNAYQWVKERITSSADHILDRPLEIVEIQNQPLSEAIEILAKAADLKAICYPYDQATGPSKLEGDVKVTVSGKNMKLADALKSIDEQVKSPSGAWVTFDVFDGVIFPADQDQFHPIAVNQTPLVIKGATFDDELLDYCRTPSGQPLSEVAFMVTELLGDDRSGALVKVNEDGPRMEVVGPKPGMLLWRVVEAISAHVPEELTEELRKQVVEDLQIQIAFEAAAKRAGELAKSADSEGLASVADQADIESETTGLFSRKSLVSPQQLLAMQMRFGQINQDEFLARVMTVPPVVLQWSPVPGMFIPAADQRQEFMRQAFALAPEDIEPAVGDVPYPDKPYAIATIALPARREVVVIQRADYRPAVTVEYEKEGRLRLAQVLGAVNQWEMRQKWFSVDEAIKRLRFEREES